MNHYIGVALLATTGAAIYCAVTMNLAGVGIGFLSALLLWALVEGR